MAKPHKFAWNGLDVETTLGFEQLANMAQRAAQESTGDLMHGKHRIVSVRSTERQIEFRINDYLISFKKYMVFHLDFESRGGRTWMSSRIDWYVTTQPNVGGFIPVGFKTMIGHFTYMQFVRNLAEQVKSAKDGSAEKRALAFDQIKAEAELKMTGELFQRQLNLSQGDLYKQAFLEVSGAIDQVAKQNGYQLVLRNDADVQLPANISGQDMENFIANQRVFYADSSLDITEQVVLRAGAFLSPGDAVSPVKVAATR